ncbi:MAG: DinB family protein [bacterium]
MKDLIAHLSWRQREMVGVLKTHALVGSLRWDWPIERRNEAIFLENRERPLEEIREEARGAFTQLLDLLESLPEEDLFDPGRFPGIPPDWQPWTVIASNAYEHDEAHLRQLQAWLERKGPLPE